MYMLGLIRWHAGLGTTRIQIDRASFACSLTTYIDQGTPINWRVLNLFPSLLCQVLQPEAISQGYHLSRSNIFHDTVPLPLAQPQSNHFTGAMNETCGLWSSSSRGHFDAGEGVVGQPIVTIGISQDPAEVG